MWANIIMSSRCLWLIGRVLQALNPREVTSITRHKTSTGQTSFQASMNANLIHCPAVHVYMHERGLWPAKKPLGDCSNHLPVNGWWPSLVFPSPREADVLPYGDERFLVRHPGVDPTSGHRAPSRALLRNTLTGNGCL